MKTHPSLKSLIVPLASILALPGMALGQAFNPVPLTQSSYEYSIVVPASTVAPLNYCVNTYIGSGQMFSDTTLYEQGLVTPTPPGGLYSNAGIPRHGTTFTNINNSNMAFLMPPSYLANDDLMIVESTLGGISTGTLTLTTPTNAVSLAILSCGGNGGCTVSWTVNYTSGNTSTGSFGVPDWFNNTSVAWGANGRVNAGGLNDQNSSSVNNNTPYMDGIVVSGLSSTDFVASITFNYVSGGGVDNFFGVSASTDGTHYKPCLVTGFDEMSIVPNTTPYPVTATMDNGTNLVNPGNTWYEQGFYPGSSGSGLPPSGTEFASVSQPTHAYQMGNYSTNDAVLIDSGHLSANLTPVTPAAYTALAFLTAGANIGNSQMTNLCIIQHADGVNETNFFYAYDWFNTTHSNAQAWVANGRVSMNSRTINTYSANGQGFPYLFESYFPLVDNLSPVTNVEVKYFLAASGSTTFIMAESASTTAFSPIITEEPTPVSQTEFTGQSANISVLASGSFPLTNTWLVESNGIFVPMQNGTDVNGSTVSGATTNSLTISGLTLLDGTNYEFIASNAGGSVTSSVPASIIVRNGSTAGVAPIAEWNNIANETYPLGTPLQIFSSTGPSGGFATFNVTGTAALNGYASDNGTNGNGGNSSLMDGYMDAGAGGNPATVTISGLNNSTTYTVYIYDFGDESRPQDATDGLPNYEINGAKYYAPTLGGLTPSYWNVQDVPIGGTNFTDTGFTPTTTQATNDLNADVSESNFGDYTEITGVTPVSGTITIAPEFDTTSFRSPFNGIELVPAASGPSFGIHFLGNTADPVAITPEAPYIQFQAPLAGTVQVPTNHPASMPLSVTLDEGSTQPLSYQWYSVSSGNVTQAISGATAPTYDVVTTNSARYFCIITNFVGSATSAPVSVNIFIPSASLPYESAVMALNPIAYWPMNETNGTIAFDYAGTNNGTYQGGFILGQTTLPATAGFGQTAAPLFDGFSGDVDIPSGGANWNLNITGPMTVIEWLQCPAGGETIDGFSTPLGHSDASYRFDVAGDTAHWADPGGDIIDNNPLSNQQWHQLVGIYDGANELFYVDGQLIGSAGASTPGGSLDDLNIGRAPDYGNRYFQGNIAQVAIYNYALSQSQVTNLYNSIEAPPLVSVTPANPSLASGNNVTVSAVLGGGPASSLQWYFIAGTSTNLIAGATGGSYTLTDVPLSDNGDLLAVAAANAYGTNFGYATLTVTSAAAYLPVGVNLGPTNGQAFSGAFVTYSVAPQGSLPINYQWILNGSAVSGATNSSFTMPASCGTSLIQVAFSNAFNGGTAVMSDVAQLQAAASISAITFNTNGTGWGLTQLTNTATVPVFSASNVVELTDNGSGEASSLFYSAAQYVGSFTASYIYQAAGSLGADGVAFILQNSLAATNALGGGGGELGYTGIGNSIALEFNIYTGNGENVGYTVLTDGLTGAGGGNGNYHSTGSIDFGSGDPVSVVVNYANGVFGLSLKDLNTSDTYSTNITVGSITPILGSDLAYVGFSGGDGGATSTQTISDFQFTSIIPTVPLTVTHGSNGSIVISWPAASTDYVLQTASNLRGAWTTGPAPTISNGTASVTVTPSGSSQFYRLVVELQCQ